MLFLESVHCERRAPGLDLSPSQPLNEFPHWAKSK